MHSCAAMGTVQRRRSKTRQPWTDEGYRSSDADRGSWIDREERLPDAPFARSDERLREVVSEALVRLRGQPCARPPGQ
jgi:hypothetical protein